jgi:hypothetical protein
MSRQQQVAEIIKSGKEPTYFMKKYCKIQHQLRGLIPFETYDFQDDCVKQFQEHRFNIVLKSRQLGLSTVSAAYVVWYAIFKKDKNILIIATKLNTAINFIKKVKTMLDGLPPWLLLTKFEPTKQSIRFTNGSTITAVPTSPDAGRSEALALLIVDEAAFIRDFDEIWTSLYPTLSTGGSAIILSTPNGVGGQYYKLWVEAESGANDFNPIRLPWWVHPEHDQEWFDKETKNLPKRKMAQEFLCVAKGTRIVTKDGFRHVEDLCVGDEVLTHRGRFKKILQTHVRNVEEGERIFSVTSPGNRTNNVIVTGDHPALSYRFWANGVSSFDAITDEMSPDWIPIVDIASKKKSTDRLLTCIFPVLESTSLKNDLESIDLTDVHDAVEKDDETCRYSKQWGKTKRFVPVDYDLGKMVGLYLAEGCESHCGGLDLGFHIDEYDTHLTWVEKYLTQLGCRVISAKDKKANGCRVWTYNKFFGSLMRKFVLGKYASDKHLDWDLVMRTNKDFVRGLLEGHYLGDGNHRHTKKFSIFSTSSRLIYQLRSLYSLYGLHPRIGRGAQSKKKAKHHDLWYLEFYANGSAFNDLIHSGQTRLPGTRLVRHKNHFVGKLSIEEVTSLTEETDVAVYDIKVEDDASFVAESIILHNCDFISSGDTFLQSNDLERLRDLIRPPMMKTGHQNGVWIWRNPEPAKKYVMSADVARGDASDFSAFHIIDYETCEVCVEFLGKIPPDRFSDLLAEYGKKYNDALICPEQNTFGYFTCVRLRDMGYPKLYYPGSHGDIFEYKSPDPEAIPGFSTQTKTRNQILTKLEELVRNGKLTCYSQRLYDQFQAFIWNGSKAQASKDAHDDLIMSLAIGTWLVAGDGGFSEQGMSMAMAMLKATYRGNRSIAELPGGINDVKPVISPHAMGYTPQQVAKPRDPSQVKHADVTDFSWLYK